MKIIMLAALVSLAATTGTAFAQSAPASNNAQVAQAAGTADQNGQWVPPDAQPLAGKTRAQVYQELVQSEQDGQLAYLNRTIYAHH
ncbi:DUF4148 domain-containing protein [Paraburkholderia sp. DHOC27]|uniref:DUF4148 domain-containing protein n=1 Tax=Paraburkholderia sp. DHOC27 TaxID=2303330 RepID=UPI000E3D23B2|nr:DUF4148 domain-containing protein [Paraburkholderia sp. DHOC27]RFU45118.1 DUF4148 domain-containing protein [Paraburkholderia sp. DHOC27]